MDTDAIRRWLARRPQDLSHAPRYPLWMWAKAYVAHAEAGHKPPGDPPLYHLNGRAIGAEEVKTQVAAARVEFQAIARRNA